MQKPRLTHCVELAGGDFVAAALLHQIIYWFPKATIEFDKRQWIAKSRQEWSEETAIPLHKYDRAVARLKSMALVEVEPHKFKGKTVSHVTLSEIAQRRLVERGVLQISETRLSQMCETTHSQMCETPYTETTETEITGTPSASTGAGGATTDQGGSKMKQKGGYSVADVAKAPKKAPKLEDKVLAMETAWKGAVADVTGEFVPDLTQKGRGQLKRIIKACPPGTAAKTMLRAVTHWHQFVEQCKEDTGKTKWSPSKPDLSFLVTNLQTAINFTPGVSPDEGWAAESPTKPIPDASNETWGEW